MTRSKKVDYAELSVRERQIMDVIYRRERATVADIRGEIPDAPTDSALRTMLARLEEKGHLRHEQDGGRNVYFAASAAEEARDSTLRRVIRTFFDDSPAETVAAVLDMSATELSQRELDRLEELIASARRRSGKDS